MTADFWQNTFTSPIAANDARGFPSPGLEAHVLQRPDLFQNVALEDRFALQQVFGLVPEAACPASAHHGGRGSNVVELTGIDSYVINARRVKNVPGRKTDVQDSEWLAELARCGLLRPSFIPIGDFREMRMLTRYRRKLSGYLSGEKNRLHKVLDNCGIRLGCVVSDIDGVSGRAMPWWRL